MPPESLRTFPHRGTTPSPRGGAAGSGPCSVSLLRDRGRSSICRPWLAGAFLCLALSGCTVVTVGAAAVGVTATAVGLAADAAVGTAKIVGKGVGKAYDAVTDDKPDDSGISIKYRESDPGHPYRPPAPEAVPAAPSQPQPTPPAFMS